MSFSAPKNNTTRVSNQKNLKSKKKDVKLRAFDYSKNLYQKYYAKPNMPLINQLKDNYLSLYLDHLTIKDISVISEILLKYFYFQQIELSPTDPQKPESTSKRYKNNKEIKEQKEKIRNMANKIIISISKNLSLSKSIINLSINNIDLFPKNCEYLSKGIIENKSLQGLKISNSQIQLSSYELLLKGLLNHISITYLDLSNNNLGDRYGNMISRIITRQAQRRDQIIWSYGLRNEKPINNDYKKGLISVNLSGNKLGKDSAELISNALGTDQYLRAIYLNDNKIENASCKKFIYMMRKNLCLLTLDLRNNPGYDEYIHSRLVMKMSKNIRYLYQQFKKGEYTEEEFENYKEFIDATFFDVDIPQEVVEFYNNNLPETSENNAEKENTNEKIESESKDEEKLEENKVLKNNFIAEDEDKKDIILKNKKLFDENLKLKQEIIELKAKNLQNKLGTNKKNEIYKETESDIDSYYHRVEELINELNDIMNKIEKKKLKQNETTNNNQNQINDDINKEEIIKIKKEENPIVIKKDLDINLPVKVEETKEKEDKIDTSQDKIDIKDKLININKDLNKDKEKEKENENKIILKKEVEEEEKNNENKKNKNEDLEPIEYQGVLGEPSEERDKESSENNNSHFVDEEGNIHNYDDLTEEEKMVIIQQQLILQRLQEEAEARGEQFDPQEYIEFLERQALEEEEEEDTKEKKSSNKLNKSF